MVQRTSAEQLSMPANQWLGEALAAGEEMGSLIGAMVTFQCVTEVPEKMPLGLLLRGLRIEMKNRLSEVGARLSISGLECEAEVSRCLSPLLRELVINSCRFRKPGIAPEIGIAVSPAGPQAVEVAVQDNGTGVAEEYYEAIFHPFRRMHSRSEYPGFGLGLAVCRRIAAANRGSIAASASALGGLCVRVVLPAD
jgi:light-regulated signal transduction histidine kinase (bacteriophytochrome)